MAPGLNAGDVVRRAMGALALRQRAITNNLANVDTPGFRSSDVNFEGRLQSALGASGGLDLARTHSAHLSVTGAAGGAPAEGEVVTRNDTTLREDGNNVDVEQQMLQLSETVITYGALARLASGRLALLRSAITEGRR
jgi:flagellar basal-body rod protein FlgB